MTEAPPNAPPPAPAKAGTCHNCGQPMKHRSWRDHRMYWAIMRRAFDDWPHDHKFQPDTPEHLHGWLLIETKHCISTEVKTDNEDVAKAIARAIFGITAREIHCMRIFDAGADGIRISVPEPFNGEDAGKRKYEQIRKDVYALIESVLGVPIETIKRARVAE